MTGVHFCVIQMNVSCILQTLVWSFYAELNRCRFWSLSDLHYWQDNKHLKVNQNVTKRKCYVNLQTKFIVLYLADIQEPESLLWKELQHFIWLACDVFLSFGHMPTGFDWNKFRLVLKVYSFEGPSVLVLLTAWKVLWCITDTYQAFHSSLRGIVNYCFFMQGTQRAILFQVFNCVYMLLKS